MALVQNFNVTPYFDDYDEDKKFLRMLFRPGYAIQARELTQLQTILQKQVSRFGTHIFKNGSVVTGGEISISSTVLFHVLHTTDRSGNDIDVNNFLGKNIATTHEIDDSVGSLGKVVAVAEGTDAFPPTIFVEYKTALSLADGQTFYTNDSDRFEGVLLQDDPTGRASVAYINEGVYYIDGFFVKVDAQTLILEKYNNTPTYRVGLTYNESIVDERTDSTLLDPALNASNYQAPGSTRYKVELVLAKRDLDSTDDTKFIELIRVENGVVTLKNNYPLYADLERTLARRTYDESGNYTVNPFTISLLDHVPPTLSNTSNSSLITAKLSAGKAYVRGFEVETVSPTNLDIEKSRTTANVQNYDIAANYGNYIVVANTFGPVDVSTMQILDMHCVDAGQINQANTTTYNSTKIGTVRVRELEYVSAANTQQPTTYKHRLYLNDTRFTSITGNAVGGNTNTITIAGDGASSIHDNAYQNAFIRITTGPGFDGEKYRITSYEAATRNVTISDTFTTNPLSNTQYSIDFNIRNIDSFATINSANILVTSSNVDSLSVDSITGDTYFSDTDFKSLVFRIPQSFISFGMTDQDYRGRVVFKNQTVSSGTLAISTGDVNKVFVGTGSLSDSQVLEHFYVVANNATGAPEFTNGQVIPFVSGTGRSISVSTSTATLDFNTSNTFTADVVASIDFNSTTQKTKSLVSANTTAVAASGGTTIGNTTVYLTEGQIAISTPNKTPGQSDSLYISDVYKLEGKFEQNYASFFVNIGGSTFRSSFKVIDSQDAAAAVTTSDLSNTSKDITSRYTLDNGQRDGFYDHASITLRPGSPPPTGQILILVNYFNHVGTGYCTVDSYNNASLGATEDVRYIKIPNYTSPTTGEVFKLRDCVDFRPIRTNASSLSPNFTLSGVSIPKAGESLESDYSYYLARTDRIVLKENRKFEVIKGVPSLNPKNPVEPDNSMSLYTIRVNPYTFFPSDTRIRFIENKRYTMRDVGRLEKRIENLEYYTSLNTLEKSAQDLTVLDSSGLTRFKNGILVDSFRGHQVGDVKNNDYKCSMDFEQGELRPSFYSNSVSFSVVSASTTANLSAGTIYTSPYEVVPVIVQNVATTAIAVNPFTLTSYSGTIEFYPPGDFWIDTETRPDVLINLEGENDAWLEIGAALEDTRAAGWGTQWNDWNSFVTGSNLDVNTSPETRVDGYYVYEDTVKTSVTTTYYSRERFGTNKVLVPERIVKSVGNRLVDLSVIPYIRPQWIMAKAQGLKPNESHYLFVDELDATKYVEYPTQLWLYDLVGTFNDNYGVYEQITSSSGGTARVMSALGRSWSLYQPHLFVSDVRGDFNTGDTITGSVSGATAKLDVIFWNNGNVVSSTANTITLSSSAPYDNVYVNDIAAYANISFANTGIKIIDETVEGEYYTIKIIAGTGIGQERSIESYDGNTKVLVVTTNWDVQPDNTSRWTVGEVQSDDSGKMPGRIYLPNYGATSYDSGWRSRTGARLFRLCNDANNNPDLINSFAEEYWHAQGVLNVIEDVSVSVRVPTIQNQALYQREENYTSSSVVDREILGTRLVADNTPPPPPPPPPPSDPAPFPAPPPGNWSPPPPPPPPPPRRRRRNCSIICTKLYQLGFLSHEIYEADQIFGDEIIEKNPDIYNGYVAWAQVVVDWIEGRGPQCMFWIRDDEKRKNSQKKLALWWARKIATPWAYHMAYLMGTEKEDSPTGKALWIVGAPICKVIGWWQRKFGKSEKEPGIFKGYLLWAIFTTLRLVVAIMSPLENKKFEDKK